MLAPYSQDAYPYDLKVFELGSEPQQGLDKPSYPWEAVERPVPLDK
jgi:hypothetical protein